MARSAVLNVKIVSDASGASKGFEDAESRVDRFSRGLDKASVAAGGVLLGLGAMAKGAFDAASELEQSTGAINAVFGDWALDVEQAAQTAAGAVGLSTSAYETMAAKIGAALGNMGFDHGKAMDATKQLISTGADLAAVFGGTTADAVDALGAALRGETDPIERYGISIKQSTINAALHAQGLDKLTGAALTNATAQTVLSLVQKQSASSTGQFAAQTNTAAVAQQIATAAWENAQATLGQVLLPIVTAAATKFAEFTQFLVENKDTVVPLIAVVGGLAAGVLLVNGAVTTYRAVAAVATAAQWLFNAAMTANPIGIVVVAIGALVAAVVYAYNKFAWFRDIVKSIWEWLKKAWDWAGKVVSAVGDFFGGSPSMTVGGAQTGVASPLMGAPGGPAGLLRAAPMFAGSGGGVGPTAGPGLSAGDTYNITVNGALDPVAVGRQLERVLRDYGRATGRQLSLSMAGTS